MAYNKRNNSERLPKLEYFQVRLKDAVLDGNQDKADYYRSRIAELKAQSTNNQIYNVDYARKYANKVSKLHDPSAEIAWLFSKLPREEQDSLVEIFDLNFQDNE